MRTKLPAEANGEPPDNGSPPHVMNGSCARPPGRMAAAGALFLAALGSCDSDPVVEPEPALQIVPDSVTLTHLGQRFAFAVRDGSGVETSQVRWSTLDGAVFTVDSDGTVTARGNGVAHVRAWTRESSDQALVHVRQVAAAFEAIGSGQSTTPGQAPLEPVGVHVLDAGGAPASKAAVRFQPAAGSGRVEPSEAYSDDAGMATVRWTLGPRPGRQTLRAVSAEGAASVMIEAMALDPDDAVALLEVRSGENQWAVRGRAVPEPVSVRVTDETDRPVWGATVQFEPDEGNGHTNQETTATDSLGLASVVWTLGPELGAQRLLVKAGELEVVFEAAAVSDQGACNRTPAVSAEIARRSGVGNCSEVTDEMLGDIGHLLLDGKAITRLRDGDFDGLVRLEELYLYSNGLTELPSGIFSDLVHLRRLLLSSNELTQLSPDALKGLSHLEELYLSQNRLTELEPETFSDLDALERVSISYNALTELPEDLFDELTNLSRLYLRGNRLTSLPEGIFAGLASLRDLVVAENQLTELPSGLFGETSVLGRLALDGNELTVLPSDLFLETPTLQRLYLQGNRLETLPPDIFARLQDLVRLDLSYNSLVELPPGVFAGTPKLAELSLELNELTELPRGAFAGLSELEWVTLYANPGAPFPVRQEFARVDNSDPLAAGPATVVVRVPVGAPFAFDVPVSVQRGTTSRDFVSLLPGDTISTAFEVSANTSGEAVHIGFGPPLKVRAQGYEGLKVAHGEELVLFAEADNRSPVARTPVPAHRLQVGGPSAQLALGYYFDDPDGDELAYEVATTESGVVDARIEAGVLWLDPMSVDTTDVEVTATDPGGLRATHRFRTWVVPAPDPDAFNIELYFDPGFMPEEKTAIRRAADRWMEVVTGDLPDVPVRGALSDGCFGGPSPPRVVGVIDDLLIRMRFAARLGANAATATTCGVREESAQAFLGENSFALWYFRDPDPVVDRLYESALHEIGHVLGFGDWVYRSHPPAWRAMFRGGGTDPHFTGPLAVAAFDAAGGDAYSGGKVPLEDRIPVVGIHWRQSVIPGDVMAPYGDSLLTAITVQTLADLGYEVDVSGADPYTLPGQAQGDVRGAAADAERAVAELFADDVIQSPVVVVDRAGKVVRVIRP